MTGPIRYDGAARRAYRRHRADGASRAEARALVERGAYTCGTCGRRWAWGTPAARCPWEYDH